MRSICAQTSMACNDRSEAEGECERQEQQIRSRVGHGVAGLSSRMHDMWLLACELSYWRIVLILAI